jgi:acyl-CoA thioesterase YciA
MNPDRRKPVGVLVFLLSVKGQRSKLIRGHTVKRSTLKERVRGGVRRFDDEFEFDFQISLSKTSPSANSSLNPSFFPLAPHPRLVPSPPMSDPTRPPHVEPLIRTIAMPSDTNPNGDIFGGWLMAQMDLAAGNAAMRRARGRCVTVAVEGMVFHRPVLVGDEVSLYGAVLQVGRTSMTIRVEAWRRSRIDEAEDKVTEGTFTFVAIDENRKPRLVPPAP